jgi:SGNH hydrolase-like domain, acetyltransferase AlgX
VIEGRELDRVTLPPSNGILDISSRGSVVWSDLRNIPVDSRLLRFALMPPYLNTLRFSQAELEKHSGWQITRRTILEMKTVSDENGATLVVLFIPFKSQVYLPLLERTFGREDLERAFQFYFRHQPAIFDLKEMSQNRLAQNELMRRFCEDEHILLIDPTAALQKEVESGRNMYFPDDSHWNAAGHELAADAINAFLRSHGLDQTKE